MTRYRKGLSSESRALWFLRLKGYRILARRYKTPFGEIDLVASRGRILVFVEVKARDIMSDGLEAVTPKSQERIQRAAMRFVQQSPGFQDHDWRFDAIVVRPRRLPYHMKDAWRP